MSVLTYEAIPGGTDHTKGFIITEQVRRAQALWIFLGGGISPDSSVKLVESEIHLIIIWEIESNINKTCLSLVI